jgi:hypothetical protein
MRRLRILVTGAFFSLASSFVGCADGGEVEQPITTFDSGVSAGGGIPGSTAGLAGLAGTATGGAPGTAGGLAGTAPLAGTGAIGAPGGVTPPPSGTAGGTGVSVGTAGGSGGTAGGVKPGTAGPRRARAEERPRAQAGPRAAA